MKKIKQNQQSTKKVTPRSRISSTNSIKAKNILPLSNSKCRENNKQNQTNNIIQTGRKKLFKEDNTNTINGFKNIKAKVTESKKPIDIPSLNLNKSSKKLVYKSSLTSGKSTPRTLCRPSVQAKEQCNIINYTISERKSIQKKIAIGQFKLGRKVQENAFSATFQAMQTQSRLCCCIKVIEKKTIKEQCLQAQLLSQIKLRLTISHPNLLKLYGYFADQVNFYIIEELYSSNTLDKNITKVRRFSQKQSGIIAKQLLDTLRYLHSEQIIHRDLRNEKIGNTLGLIKIIDFTWIVSLSKKNHRDTFCGSFRHVPPQLLSGESYNYSVDLWNFGVAVYEMVTGINPFSTQTLTNLENLTFPIFLSNEIVDLLGKILIEKKNRLRLEEIESHEWMKKYEMNGLVGKEFWNFWK